MIAINLCVMLASSYHCSASVLYLKQEIGTRMALSPLNYTERGTRYSSSTPYLASYPAFIACSMKSTFHTAATPWGGANFHTAREG